jgi:hypothetical protein
MTPDDRQSYYEDCHTWQDESDKTPGSAHKGCLSKGYRSSSSTRTYRTSGTAHNDTVDSEGIFLATEDCCCSIVILIYQIKGFYKRP